MRTIRSLISVAMLLVLCVASIGCASIIHGSSQEITITSNPSDALVQVDGSGSYKTPVTVDLERDMDHSITVSMDGYHQKQVTIMHVMSGAVAGNILAGGLIGWGVDAMTGAQYKLVPETVHVELRELKQGEQAPISSANISDPMVRLKRLKELQDEGLITDDEYEAMRKRIVDEMKEE